MPEPSPVPPPQKPAPSAPGFGEMLEQSLAAIFDPSVFRRAAARPAPSLGASSAFALAAGATAFALNLARAASASPDFLRRFPAPLLAAVLASALFLYVGATFMLGTVLYGAGNGFGGKGEFARGLQAAAMISALGPAQMLCNRFPLAWIVPALLAGWLAAGALTGLFDARARPARVLCAALALGAVGLQALGAVVDERAREAYAVARAAQETANAGASMTAAMQELQHQAAASAGSAPDVAAAPPAVSGLDLLRGPSSDAPGAAPTQARALPPAMAAASQGLQTNALGMLDAITPMIDNLASAKNAAPQQRADLKELQGLISDLKAQIVSGKKLDNAAYAERTARYQKLLMKVMAESAAPARGEMNLDGKVVLVTGAARRVGRVIALAYAAKGARVAVHCNASVPEARRVAAAAKSLSGADAEVFRADLLDPKAPQRLADAVARRFGRLDILINSASAYERTPFAKASAEDWDYQMTVNARAPFFLAQASAPYLKRSGAGLVINIADWSAHRPYADYGPYCASKAALLCVNKVLAKALAPEVRVNAILPGPVLAPEGMGEAEKKKMSNATLLKRLGTPEAVARACLFLAESADYSTGAELTVDGGRLVA